MGPGPLIKLFYPEESRPLLVPNMSLPTVANYYAYQASGAAFGSPAPTFACQ